MYACIYAHSQRLIDECPGDGVQDISIFQPQCANMIFTEQSRYNRIFQKVVQKGDNPEINYIKIFKNLKALKIPVGKNYTENQLVHTLLHNFCQGGKYSAQIVSHQSELIREEIFVDQISLSIFDFLIDSFDLDNSVRNNERAKFCSIKVKLLWRFTPN